MHSTKISLFFILSLYKLYTLLFWGKISYSDEMDDIYFLLYAAYPMVNSLTLSHSHIVSITKKF